MGLGYRSWPIQLQNDEASAFGRCRSQRWPLDLLLPASAPASSPAPPLIATGVVIAFPSERDGNTDTYVTNADGTGATRPPIS
jgi:hypothetical protein